MQKNNKETISDRIFQSIGDEIVNGLLKSGEKISEPQLAKRFGTSRAPIREAIRRLEERGLIIRKPRSGPRVTSFSFEQFLEIFEIREALEGKACWLAAERLTEAELAKIRRIVEGYEKKMLDQPGNSLTHQTRDLDFHFQIALGSKNSALIRFLCDDYYNLLRLYRKRHPWAYSRRLKAHKEHIRILEALEERDGELAELMMRRHINAAETEIKMAYEQRAEKKQTHIQDDSEY